MLDLLLVPPRAGKAQWRFHYRAACLLLGMQSGAQYMLSTEASLTKQATSSGHKPHWLRLSSPHHQAQPFQASSSPVTSAPVLAAL